MKKVRHRNVRRRNVKTRREYLLENLGVKQKEVLVLVLVITIILAPLLCYQLILNEKKNVKPPKITIFGEDVVELNEGDAYKEPGYSACDAKGKDLTKQVVISGNVNTDKPGEYEIRYKVTDKHNQTVIVQRKVFVHEKKKENPPSPMPESTDEKIIYLTFDDGPGPYTEDLLKILEQYQAHATFFVTNQYEEYQYVIAKEHEMGNAVGIHSYSHQYGLVYQSKKNFYNDIEKMNAIIEKQIGSKSKLLRFPGGSSNTISKEYCRGIMSELTKSVEADGYHYYDWNVDSDDAGHAKTAEQVAANVISGVKGKRKAIVLQHDVKDYSVVAVEKILKWGIKNGYNFLALTEDSYEAHHGVNN